MNQPTNTDSIVVVQVKDLAGTPLVLSAYAAAIVVLSTDGSLINLAEYKTSDGTLEILDATNGYYTFNLKRSITKDFKNNQKLMYTVRMYQTDDDFDSDLFVIETDPTELVNYIKTANHDRND